MKKIFTQLFILVLFIPAISVAQIPNASFESWTLNSYNILDPDGWLTQNYGAASCLQYQPAQNLSYGIKLVNDSSQGFWLLGSIESKFACTILPLTLDGYYLGHFASGDELSVSVYFYDSLNNLVGSGDTTISTNTNSYTLFSVPLAFTPGITPDSAGISIDFTNADDQNLTGYVVIDNLQFIGSQGVPEISKNIPVKLWPNPASDFLHVSVPEFNPDNSTIKIIDLSGRKIEVEILKQSFFEGNGNWEIKTDDLSNGLYHLMISDGKMAASKSFLIAR